MATPAERGIGNAARLDAFRRAALTAAALFLSIAPACGTNPDGETPVCVLDVEVVMNCMPFLDPDSQAAVGVELLIGADTFPLDTTDTLATGIAVAGIPAPSVASLLIEPASGGTEQVDFSPGMFAGDTTTLRIHLGYVVADDRFTAEAFTGCFPPPGLPNSILFVGNSYTYANGGLSSHVDSLLSCGFPGARVRTGEYTMGGATFENHFNDAICRSLITTGGWDLVVLQEQSLRPIEDPALMWRYAFLLDSLVEASGGETGFFMTWPREYAPGTLEDLEYAYDYAGAHLDASVAPVGTAWLLALSMEPALDLWDPDQSHPTVSGTYLAACVFYSLLTGESAEGLGYCPPGIEPANASLMQAAAWEAVSSRAPVNWRWF